MDGQHDTTRAATAPETAARTSQQQWADFGNVNSCGPPDETSDITRVLVADANATVRKILRHVFASLGWETLEAQDGPQALELARRRPHPQAILLDLKLSQINGY